MKHIYIIEWFDDENTKNVDVTVATWKWEDRYEEAKEFLKKEYDYEANDIDSVYFVSDFAIKEVYKSIRRNSIKNAMLDTDFGLDKLTIYRSYTCCNVEVYKKNGTEIICPECKEYCTTKGK